jgi:hypothetical protein
MTADVDWNSSMYDNNIDDFETFYDANDDDILYGAFDQYGEYRYHTIDIHKT